MNKLFKLVKKQMNTYESSTQYLGVLDYHWCWTQFL